VVLQLTEELHSQQPIQGHEEQEEQRDIVYLLTRTPNKHKHVISNNNILPKRTDIPLEEVTVSCEVPIPKRRSFGE
jgi:hypothetical protein